MGGLLIGLRHSCRGLRLLLGISAALYVLAADPSRGSAQGPPETADASALVAEGVRLRELREDAAALELFERAQRMTPSPATLAQIALAEQALGRWAQAYDHLREALAADDPWIAGQRPSLEGALEVVAGHVGWLEVLCDLEDATLLVDTASAPLGERMTVRAGLVVVEVAAPGHRSVRRELEVAPGRHVRETVALPLEQRALDPADPELPPPSSTPNALVISGATSLALAGALGIASIVTGVLALTDRDRLRDECRPTVCPEALMSVQQSARDLAVATDVLWVGAAVLAAAAAVLLPIGLLQTDAAAPHVGAACTPDGCLVVAMGELR